MPKEERKMAVFKGAGVAIITPMKDNLEVDYDAFSAIIEDGKNSKYLVRKLIDCYNRHYGNTIS